MYNDVQREFTARWTAYKKKPPDGGASRHPVKSVWTPISSDSDYENNNNFNEKPDKNEIRSSNKGPAVTSV